MYKDNVREIDIKDLFFHILFRWRSIIICGLTGLLILGGFQYYKAESRMKNYEHLVQNGSDTAEALGSSYKALQKDLKDNIRKVRSIEVKITGKEAEIKTAQGKIGELRDDLEELGTQKGKTQLSLSEAERRLEIEKKYVDASVYLSLDASEKPMAQRVFQVILSSESERDRELYRDPADEIVAAYFGTLNVVDAIKELAQKYGMGEQYVTELFSVKKDDASNTITVSATGVDRAMALTILESVCDAFKQRQEEISECYQAHELRQISNTYRIAIDDDLQNKQNAQNDQMLKISSSIDTYTAKLAEIETDLVNTTSEIETQQAKVDNLKNDIIEFQEDIAELERERATINSSMKKKIPTLKTVRKVAVKYGLIGLLAGVVAAAFLYCILYLLDDRIHTSNEIGRYYGLPILASVPSEHKKTKCFIDRLLYHFAEKEVKTSVDDVLEAASLTVETLTQGMKAVVLLGNGGSGPISRAKEKLENRIQSLDFVQADNVFSSESDIALVMDCDAVILCVIRNSSRISEISAEIDRVQLFGKKILGFIVG